MTFEHIGHSLVATLTADDMNCCHIEFTTMNLSDCATRALLHDMLSLMEHMGLRRSGERVTVECGPDPDGGCLMLLTVQPSAEYRFECCDDVISAAQAGAMPQSPYSLVPDGEGFILVPHAALSDEESLRLSEFCRMPSEPPCSF